MLHIILIFAFLNVALTWSQKSPIIPRATRSRDVIVVTGNFSIDGQLVNIAEYDISQSK